MSWNLSSNAKAILLLTAPLIAGRGGRQAELLTPGEYKRLARRLREIGRQPSDLLAAGVDEVLEASRDLLDPARLKRLLERGFLLSQAVERWQARAIWVTSRADPEYPQRLKSRLKGNAPPLLYGCGERRILESGGLAVVGSRQVTETLIELTLEVCGRAASAGATIVSGGARGIDQASMNGALEAGGKAIGVLADRLERAAMNRDHRELLLDRRLVLISPYDPSAGFNVGHAMQRNKVIYALADAALVVHAEVGKGGTWAGAIEQLDRLSLVPVYVRSTGDDRSGLEALQEKGALPWPNPRTAEEFRSALSIEPKTLPGRPEQASLPLIVEAPVAQPPVAEVDLAEAGEIREPDAASVRYASSAQAGEWEPGAEVALPPSEDDADHQCASDPAGELFARAQALVLKILERPQSARNVAEALDVTQRQAEIWLRRLVDRGLVGKTARPVRYVSIDSGSRREGRAEADAAEGQAGNIEARSGRRARLR